MSRQGAQEPAAGSEKTAPTPPEIASLAEFWPYYLREHTKPLTRAWHYLGASLVLLCLIALLVSGDPWWLPAILVAGYGPAWIGHFFVEHNRPATFRHPLWSLISDWRMVFTWACGRLGPELARAGLAAGDVYSPPTGR